MDTIAEEHFRRYFWTKLPANTPPLKLVTFLVVHLCINPQFICALHFSSNLLAQAIPLFRARPRFHHAQMAQAQPGDPELVCTRCIPSLAPSSIFCRLGLARARVSNHCHRTSSTRRVGDAWQEGEEVEGGVGGVTDDGASPTWCDSRLELLAILVASSCPGTSFELFFLQWLIWFLNAQSSLVDSCNVFATKACPVRA